ncbi:MAG: hypothetical protein LBK82_05925 [Planctomycetaceae bacterium]|nr:hypothetical protein [Planctomycetaceae bacterium]
MNQINDGKIMTQPAQPPSGRIAHPFSPTAFDELPASFREFSCLKRIFQCLDTLTNTVESEFISQLISRLPIFFNRNCLQE